MKFRYAPSDGCIGLSFVVSQDYFKLSLHGVPVVGNLSISNSKIPPVAFGISSIRLTLESVPMSKTMTKYQTTIDIASAEVTDRLTRRDHQAVDFIEKQGIVHIQGNYPLVRESSRLEEH